MPSLAKAETTGKVMLSEVQLDTSAYEAAQAKVAANKLAGTGEQTLDLLVQNAILAYI